MRKILLLIVLLATPIIMSAQKDVTTFLGIPVDGLKSDMINALKAKGFVPSELDKDMLKGEFNGYDVNLSIVTNNNKVYRIVVVDENYVDETAIRIRFNNLCRQFENNPRYTALDDFTIPEDEKIPYEMLVNKKRYDAAFIQGQVSEQPKLDSLQTAQEFMKLIEQKFTEEQLANPTEEMQEEIKQLAISYAIDKLSKFFDDAINNTNTIDNNMNKLVWFMIDNQFGKYGIVMYYDNIYNQANGEDL